MSWLYQPLPLATALTVTDVNVALDASATSVATGHGTALNGVSVALSGSSVTTGHGTMALGDTSETLSGLESAQEAGSLVRTTVVRLRSRKTGGTSTADRLLDGSQAIVSAGLPVKVLSVLLGGSGTTAAQQSFASKSVARLLTGQERTTARGTLTYQLQGGTGGLPAWIQLPTQVEEANFYDTNFGVGSGKEVVWTYDTADRTPTSAQGGFATAPSGAFVSRNVHNDTEADDLWNHYQMYKRTGEQRYLNWAQNWRDYQVTLYQGDMTDPNSCGTTYTHLYGQGLVIWSMERNDLTARNKALELAALVEANTLASIDPGSTGPGGNMSNNESRKWARRLIHYCYITMLEPITRWITVRDLLIEGWLQNTGWSDSSNSNIVAGAGNHFAGTNMYSGFGNFGMLQYNQGFRYNHSFMYALHTEALWLSYKLTGRSDIRDMLIKMARYILYYAWDPSHVFQMSGSRWGHRGDGTHWHHWMDDWTGYNGAVSPSTGIGPPNTPWTDPTRSPTDSYETSHINALIYGYKLTGEAAFLKRAREHLRLATSLSTDSSNGLLLAQDLVHSFVDTQKDSSGVYFHHNKGMLQYASSIFENGGAPAVEGATWAPPYPVPTSPGEVIKIAGGSTAGDPVPDATTIANQGGDSTPSTYPTNVFADVRPAEVGSTISNALLYRGDTRTKFIETFSPGGAMMIVGSGGHAETPNNMGACLFDFTDARWKRIWTTQGNPGVDNITNEGPRLADGGPPTLDVRAGTRIHNCLNYQENLIDGYLRASHFGSRCNYPPDWLPNGTGGAASSQLALVPLAADPRDQVWECSLTEPLPYNATTRPHGWPYPGEWGGMGNGRYEFEGYVCKTTQLGAAGRFDPTPAGTLEPTQSELPAPSHIWDHYYELRSEDGGGPKGSIILGRHANFGKIGDRGLRWSHRFDLNTGIYHKWSANSPQQDGINPPTSAGGPHDQGSAIASAEDKPMKRAFLIAKTLGTLNRVNYVNLLDRTWRSFNIGTGGVSPSGQTECLVVDPDRRLLIVTAEDTPHLLAIDLQTLGDTNTPEPTPTDARGGWKVIPYDDIPGVQSVSPFVTGSTAPWWHKGGFRLPWRYYPPNGKFYRMNGRSMTSLGASPPYPNLTVLQRLTPPAIIATPRPDFYYTDEAQSGRWTLDEIEIGTSIGGLPAPDDSCAYQVSQTMWFHYVPALQCLAYAPTDFDSGAITRRCVYLIKPF